MHISSRPNDLFGPLFYFFFFILILYFFRLIQNDHFVSLKLMSLTIFKYQRLKATKKMKNKAKNCCSSFSLSLLRIGNLPSKAKTSWHQIPPHQLPSSYPSCIKSLLINSLSNLSDPRLGKRHQTLISSETNNYK